MMIINMILILNMIAMSSSNVISMWYYMEMTSFMFMFTLMKNKNPMESCVIYFIISFIATIMILSAIVQMNMNSMELNLSFMEEMKKSNFLPLAFFMKMGIIPLHSWVFSMTKNMKWDNLLILFSIQKFIPIWMIMSFSSNMMSMLFIFINSLLTPFLPLKSNSSFYLISISSVMNGIWIIMSTLCSLMTTIVFSLSYFTMNSNLILLMKKNNSKENISENSMQTLMGMLALMGFPPLPNFFIKLLILKNILMMYTNMMFFSIVILISNMISTIMYVKFMLMSVINFKNLLSLLPLKKNSHYMNNFSMMSPILLLLILLYN